MDKYVAYFAVESVYEEFKTFKEAKNWLQECQSYDVRDEGYPQESCDGEDYIAKITHRSKYKRINDCAGEVVMEEMEGNNKFNPVVFRKEVKGD